MIDEYDPLTDNLIERLRRRKVTHHQISDAGEPYETISWVHLVECIKLEAADALEAKDAEIAELREQLAHAQMAARAEANEVDALGKTIDRLRPQCIECLEPGKTPCSPGRCAARSAETLTEIDGCSEENCRRCRTAPNLRGNMAHAGIGSYPSARGTR